MSEKEIDSLVSAVPSEPDGLSIQEPTITLEDTPPSGFHREATQPVAIPKGIKSSGSRSKLPWLLYGMALIITVAAAVLYIQQGNTPVEQPTKVALNPTEPMETALPSIPPPTAQPTAQPVTTVLANDASLAPDAVAELLLQTGKIAPASDQLYRLQTAYTIAPARTRSGIIMHTIRSGDTLDKIAAHYGISQETIIWNNDGIYVNRLLPGDQLTILPGNGIRHKTNGQETLQTIADKYKVSPYVIIDSEFNQLLNTPPSTLLPADMWIMVPGGQGTGKAAYWDPGIKVQTGAPKPGGGGPIGAYAVAVEFGGGPGSCGAQPSAGGTGGLRVPLTLGHYVITRGFSGIHSGIDLAEPAGSAVFAADRGTVIFAGWSTWGYGNAIVLYHGDKLTLYGHLSQINVGCGQVVESGAVIGAVGTTGNSTAPHLHFEIRPLPAGAPVDPTGYLHF